MAWNVIKTQKRRWGFFFDASLPALADFNIISSGGVLLLNFIKHTEKHRMATFGEYGYCQFLRNLKTFNVAEKNRYPRFLGYWMSPFWLKLKMRTPEPYLLVYIIIVILVANLLFPPSWLTWNLWNMSRKILSQYLSHIVVRLYA